MPWNEPRMQRQTARRIDHESIARHWKGTMSRTVHIACDRCSATIDGNHSVVAIDLVAGELKTRRDEPRIELCTSCGSAFLDFLKPEPFRLEAAADVVRDDVRALGRAIENKVTA
jgi:hypothetical protein